MALLVGGGGPSSPSMGPRSPHLLGYHDFVNDGLGWGRESCWGVCFINSVVSAGRSRRLVHAFSFRPSRFPCWGVCFGRERWLGPFVCGEVFPPRDDGWGLGCCWLRIGARSLARALEGLVNYRVRLVPCREVGAGFLSGLTLLLSCLPLGKRRFFFWMLPLIVLWTFFLSSIPGCCWLGAVLRHHSPFSGARFTSDHHPMYPVSAQSQRRGYQLRQSKSGYRQSRNPPQAARRRPFLRMC